MAEQQLRWVRCRLVAGHGVASGRAATSPYPAGTIQLQAPLFAARGIDLSPFFAGTLNLEAPRGHWRLSNPDARFEALEWTDRHPPETFSFWHCRLRLASEESTRVAAGDSNGAGDGVGSLADARGAAIATGEGARQEFADPAGLAALIYHPHPETKKAHHQAPGCLEVLAPWIAGLTPGQELELGVDPRRCRLVDPARLRARLLEFLKFRVLAAQEEFFAAFMAPPQSVGSGQAAAGLEPNSTAGLASNTAGVFSPPAAAQAERFRAWLHTLWPEALDLDDADLLATLDQARRLYVN